MKRFVRSISIVGLALSLACGVWPAVLVAGASTSSGAQVDSDYNAVAKAGITFQNEIEVEVANYGNTPEATFASTLAEQANRFVSPLETEQEALLNLMLNTKYSAKVRVASAPLAATITRFVYVLGLAGFASGGSTGLEAWAATFQSTKVTYQQEGKTLLTDLGYSITS